MSVFDSAEIEIAPERLAAWLAEEPDLQVVDVREPYEREAGRLEPSRHIEMERLASAAETIDRERPVVFYCRLGARSALAAQAFRAAGYQVHTMTGGLQRWADEGRPLAPEGGSVAPH